MDLSHFDLLAEKVRSLVSGRNELSKINSELECKIDDLEMAVMENEETIRQLREEVVRLQQDYQVKVEELHAEIATYKNRVESILDVLKDVEVTSIRELERGTFGGQYS